MCGRLWACTSSIPVGVCAFDQVQSVTNQYVSLEFSTIDLLFLVQPNLSFVGELEGGKWPEPTLAIDIYLPSKSMIFNLKKMITWLDLSLLYIPFESQQLLEGIQVHFHSLLVSQKGQTMHQNDPSGKRDRNEYLNLRPAAVKPCSRRLQGFFPPDCAPRILLWMRAGRCLTLSHWRPLCQDPFHHLCSQLYNLHNSQRHFQTVVLTCMWELRLSF